MTFYVGVTDNNWFDYLRDVTPEDVNFWQPGGATVFKAIKPGAPFLFKLKSPRNAIGGVGFFSSHSFLPVSVAWEVFGGRNGMSTLEQFKESINKYRSVKKVTANPMIGCIVLTNPVFFTEEDWIEVPSNWARSIVQGKSYSTQETVGRKLWEQVADMIYKYQLNADETVSEESIVLSEPELPQYGKSILTRVRVGQGAFRVLITNAYQRRCAISGEKTLPVLDAAHIKPYAQSGPHSVTNGLLLRTDIHKLFDSGYVTVTNQHKVEISGRIKEEYENGRDYYKFHGKSLMSLPLSPHDSPSREYLEWHNQNIYRG